MSTWFEIIEMTLRDGRIHIKGHWMTGEKDGPAAPRNRHTRPIELEPMMPQEAFEAAQREAMEELFTSKKGQPIDQGEKDEILASIEKSNPLYIALKKFLEATADNLKAEMGMEVSVKT